MGTGVRDGWQSSRDSVGLRFAILTYVLPWGAIHSRKRSAASQRYRICLLHRVRRTSASLARLWQEQGKRNEVHDLFRPKYDWFTEGFNTKDLQEVQALLRELEG